MILEFGFQEIKSDSQETLLLFLLLFLSFFFSFSSVKERETITSLGTLHLRGEIGEGRITHKKKMSLKESKNYVQEKGNESVKVKGVHESLLQESERDIIFFTENFLGKGESRPLLSYPAATATVACIEGRQCSHFFPFSNCLILSGSLLFFH